MGRLVSLAALVLCAVAPGGGQLLSPGALARPHAELEGLANCTKCHTAGEQVVDARCLDCHEPLAARIEQGAGYHARVEGRCVDCHGEHRGLDFEMIHWDPKAFDHDSTGYVLTGKHVNLECTQCHTRADSTYLGLQTTCASCHTDEHRGQMGERDCQSCHDTAGWKPAPGFSHDAARYPLTGRHAQLTCQTCHVVERDPQAAPDADSTFARYRPLAFDSCTDCHTDEHRGQFVSRACTDCHSVEGFKPSAVNHDESRYPLRGRHAVVDCARCHVPRVFADGDTVVTYRPIRFAQCADCHADPHAGQFQEDCASCHGVDGWKGRSVNHDETRFPLRGRHRDVTCVACHGPAPDAPAGTPATYRGLAFAACGDCHADVHEGQFEADCASCHHVDGWKGRPFDHAQARFALAGKHATVACERCHPAIGGTELQPMRRWRPVAHAACGDCHTDAHDAQFTADCAGCHGIEGFKPSVFDHDRSRFRLDGAHLPLRCDQCHLPYVATDGEPTIRYRPIDPDCRTCHG